MSQQFGRFYLVGLVETTVVLDDIALPISYRSEGVDHDERGDLYVPYRSKRSALA
jgi:hypothetical protein